MNLEEFYKIRKEVKAPANQTIKNGEVVSYMDKHGRIYRSYNGFQVLIVGEDKHIVNPKNKINTVKVTSAYDRMQEYLTAIPDSSILEYCKAIYAFRKTGKLTNDSFIKEIADKFKTDVRLTEQIIVAEAHKRYKEVLLLLFSDNPNNYLQ